MANKSDSNGERRGRFSFGRRSRGAGRGEGSGKRSDYRQKIRANKGAAKKGCSSKLFMLILPIIGVGAYLLLGS